MEVDWIEDIVANKARVLVLTDQYGNATHWASSLIASAAKWERALLDHPIGPLIIRINRAGVGRIDGRDALLKLLEKMKTIKIVRAKRHTVIQVKEGTD